MRRVVAFAAAAAALLVLALEGGGYDIVTREQFGLLVWAAIALGFAFGVLPRGRPTREAWIVLGGWGLLALLAAIAFLWSDSDERTLSELARVLQYAGVVALAFSSLSSYTWRAAAAGLAAAALAVPVLSLTARLAPDLISDKTVQLLHIDRLSYPFGYWNAVGAWGAMAIAIGLTWSAHARHVAVRALALAAVPVASSTVYLSYSRGGVVASAIALCAAVAFSFNRWTTAAHAVVAGAGSGAVILTIRNQTEIARATGDEGAGAVLAVLLLAAGGCAAAVLLSRLAKLDRWRLSSETNRILTPVTLALVLMAVGVGGHTRISDAWDEFRNERTVSEGDDPASRLTSFGGTRYDVWESAMDAFQAEPGHGIGPGTFEFYWSQEGANAEFLRDGHSLYLETLAEFGLLGGLGLLAIIVALLLGAWLARLRVRGRSSGVDVSKGAIGACVAAFVVFLFSAGVDWMWELPALGALALGSIAVACTAGFPRWGSDPVPLVPRVAIVAVALVAAAVQVPGLASTQRLRASAEQLRSGDKARAVELADESVSAEPWAAAPYAQRALAEQEMGDVSAARSDLRHSIRNEPENWRYHFLLAKLEAAAGDRAAVALEIKEVRRLAPRSVFLTPGHPDRGKIDAVLSRGG